MKRADTTPPTKTKTTLTKDARQPPVTTNPSPGSNGDEDDGEEGITEEKDEDEASDISSTSQRQKVRGGKKKTSPADLSSAEKGDPYSLPGGPRRFDYQRDEDSPITYEKEVDDVILLSPSSVSVSTTKSDPLADEEIKSPELDPGSVAEEKEEEEEEEKGEEEEATRPTSSPTNVENPSSLDEKASEGPITDDKERVKSPTSQTDINLSLQTGIPDVRHDDVGQSSPADSDIFYSIENSPGGSRGSHRRVSSKSDLHKPEPGFSIFEDIVLHGDTFKEHDLPSDFNNIVRDHVKHFGDVTKSPELSDVVDDSGGQPGLSSPGGDVDQKDDLPPVTTEDALVLQEKQPHDDGGDEEKISDTLESISLTKESMDSDAASDTKPLGGGGAGDMDAPPILPKRYIMLFLLFLGFAVVYSLRVNINVAIVAMVNNRTRLNKNGRIEIIQAEFDWDSHTQALVIGAFYYGYWILQVPGAWIAMKLGATRIFGYGVFLSSLLSLITPVATRYHVLGIVGVRVAQGLVLGVTYPCVIAIWAFWSPPLERSTMVTMTMAGSPVGNIIAIPVTGILAKYGFDGGWPSVFYFFGFLGVLWYIVWECVIYDKPEDHPTISSNERRFIEKSIGEKPFDPLTESLPWLAIVTSIPMWGIIFGHFGACWGYYTLFTQMPTYLKDVQHLDIKTMGLVASTPYLLKAFLGPIGGISADMLVKANYLTIRGVRILFYAIGCVGAGVFILLTGYYSRRGEAITFLILGIGLSGLNATGYAVNHLDLAPRYAGILMGISNTFATIPGFLSPMLTGFITKHKRASEWKIVFWITFVIYMVAVVLYTFMCSGEKQWWSEGYGEIEEEGEEEEEEDDDDYDDYDENDDDHNNKGAAKEPITKEKQIPVTHKDSDTSVESLNSNVHGKLKSRYSTVKREDENVKGDKENKGDKVYGKITKLFSANKCEEEEEDDNKQDDVYGRIANRYSTNKREEDKQSKKDTDDVYGKIGRRYSTAGRGRGGKTYGSRKSRRYSTTTSKTDYEGKQGKRDDVYGRVANRYSGKRGEEDEEKGKEDDVYGRIAGRYSKKDKDSNSPTSSSPPSSKGNKYSTVQNMFK